MPKASNPSVQTVQKITTAASTDPGPRGCRRPYCAIHNEPTKSPPLAKRPTSGDPAIVQIESANTALARSLGENVAMSHACARDDNSPAHSVQRLACYDLDKLSPHCNLASLPIYRCPPSKTEFSVKLYGRRVLRL